MPDTEAIRSEIQRLVRAVPFRPFALHLADGGRVVIKHPEQVGFEPRAKPGTRIWNDFCVVASGRAFISSFSIINGIEPVNHGEPTA